MKTVLQILSIFLLVPYRDIEGAKLSPRSESQRTTLDRTLETVVPKNYDPLERPAQKGSPTTVYVSVHMSHIEWNFDRLHVVMYLRQKWTDSRLKRRKPSTILCKPIDLQSHIWFPDVYLSNMIDETKILNNGFVRVASDGEIVYSVLLKSTLACAPYSPSKRLIANNGEMECEIALESFAYSSDEVALKWADSSAAVDQTYDSSVKSIATGEVTLNLAKGSYSRLTVNLTLDTGFSGEKLDFALRRFYGR